MKRIGIGLGIAIVIGGLLFVFTRKTDAPAQTTNQPTEQTASVEPAKKSTTRFIATGDFIAHDALTAAAKQQNGTYDYTGFSKAMQPLFTSAQIRFCNQSTLIGGDGFAIAGYPSFNAPSAFVGAFTSLGCNVVNTASNHSSDKTVEHVTANTVLWNQQPNMLAVAGQNESLAQQQIIRYFEIDGLKYAFLAYTTYSNSPPQTTYSVNMYSRQVAKQQIDEAKQNGAKFIVVSMRWGTEYSAGINAYQEAESQFLADSGVQLVLGHGPHVLEPVKKLKGTAGNETLVWYSLGNFLHAQLEAETLFNGVAVMEIDPATATITSLGMLPVYMHYDWTKQQADSQDLLARKNFELVPLEKADALFAKSQLKTTIAEQRNRLQTVSNTYTPVTLYTLQDLGL